MYKRKAETRPVDATDTDGSKPGGDDDRRGLAERRVLLARQPRSLPIDDIIIPKFSGLATGARLTPERVDRLEIGQNFGQRSGSC